MEQTFTPLLNIDAGIDQITRDRVFFDRVTLKIKENRNCEAFVVWNEGVGIERGMFFPTQGSADNYFVAITASAAHRAKFFGTACSKDIRQHVSYNEKSTWEKMLDGLPLSDALIAMNQVKENVPCH